MIKSPASGVNLRASTFGQADDELSSKEADTPQI